MAKKKVLVFIDWYLPGFKAGGPIQSVANLVAHLKQEVDFYIVTRNTDYLEEIPYPDTQADVWLEKDGVRVYYISAENLNRNTIKQLILKTPFDTVYLNGIYSLYFTLLPLFYLRKRPEHKVVLAARGMLSEGSLGVKRTKKTIFLRSVKVIRFFDDVVFHATSEKEKHDIHKALGEKTNVRFAANLPAKFELPELSSPQKESGTLRMISIARVAPEKNTLFSLRVMQHVTSDVSFDIYGPVYDSSYWKECEQVIATLPSNVKVSYKGALPAEKVLETIMDYHLFFLPSTGENFGHAIFQALTVGCPILISDQTPWKMLETNSAGWDFSLEEIKMFSKAIDKVAEMGLEEWRRWSSGARQIAESYQNDQEIIEQNRKLF